MSPQAHDQQRELHRKPPRGLSQRIMLALTVLLTGLAALYSAAMVGVIGYTEEELISSLRTTWIMWFRRSNEAIPQ